MSSTKEACPECGSDKIWSTQATAFMVNTGEHWCTYVETHDKNSPAGCLECDWRGVIGDSVET
jgi:hypothetical protein